MAYQMNTDQMARVLRVGKEKLSDKGVTSAAKRVGPLRQQTDLDRDVIIHHLVGHFRARFGLEDDTLRDDELADAHERVASRFGTREWLYFLPDARARSLTDVLERAMIGRYAVDRRE
jgi:lipoate-protein ligase A